MKEKTNKNRYIILLCTAVFMFSIGGSRPLIPLFASNLDVSNLQIGFMVSMYALLPLFLSIHIGKVIDKLGSKLPLCFAIILGSFSLIIPFFINNIMGIYLSQIIAGLSQVIFIISMQTYISKLSNKPNIREYFIAIFSIGVALGHFAGPILSGYLSEGIDYPTVLAILGVLLFIALPLPLLLKKETVKRTEAIDKKRKKGSLDLLLVPNIRYALFISAIVLIAKDLYIAFFPLLAIGHGLSTTEIGFIIALNSGAGILIRIILPYLSKWVNTNIIIKVSILNAAIIYLIHPLFSDAYFFGVLAIILGLCLGVAQPLSISITINSLPEERVGEGLGLRISFNKLAQVIFPAVLGVASGPLGITGVFYITGLFILTGSINNKQSKLSK